MAVGFARDGLTFNQRVEGSIPSGLTSRHPENEELPGVIVFRPEASLIYINADAVLETVFKSLACSRIVVGHPPRHLRSLGIALYRSCRLTHAA